LIFVTAGVVFIGLTLLLLSIYFFSDFSAISVVSILFSLGRAGVDKGQKFVNLIDYEARKLN